jgi:arabinoxylan arabinofuranohydrolase
LQFENFTCGGEGIAYHDADPTNNGGQYRPDEAVDIGVVTSPSHRYFVGWTETGEWLKYRILAGQPLLLFYPFGFAVSSSTNSGQFHIEIDDVDVTGTINVPNTGGEQYWQWIYSPDNDIYLEPGPHTIKLVIENGGGNFDSMDVISATLTPSPTYTATPNSGQ